MYLYAKQHPNWGDIGFQIHEPVFWGFIYLFIYLFYFVFWKMDYLKTKIQQQTQILILMLQKMNETNTNVSFTSDAVAY